jgi:hypothetical protein
MDVKNAAMLLAVSAGAAGFWRGPKDNFHVFAIALAFSRLPGAQHADADLSRRTFQA